MSDKKDRARISICQNARVGLFSYFFRTLSGLRASDELGIPLAVDWSNCPFYRDVRVGGNVWEYYFEQPCGLSVDGARVLGACESVDFEYSYMYTFENYQGLFPLTRRLIQRYIRFKPEVAAECEYWVRELGISGRTLGVKRRGTDVYQHGGCVSIEEFFTAVDQCVDRFDNMFVCSDEQSTIDAFCGRYGRRVVCVPGVIRSVSGHPVHSFEVGGSGFKKGLDVIVDAVVLSGCGLLVVTCSGVSHFAVCWREVPSNFLYVDSHIVYHK